MSETPTWYEPLPRTKFHTDFDEGFGGWTELIGNYDGDLSNMLPQWRDCRPPMLSSAPMWDSGSSGSLHGTYSLKLATRARRGHLAAAIKRHTFSRATTIQLETYLTAKSEAGPRGLGETNLRGFGVLFDLQDSSERAMPHLRYHNAEDGAIVGRWQYRADATPREEITGSDEGMGSTYHLDPRGWIDIPGGEQRLCYNEIASKQNWHYLRVTVDLRTLSLVEFQCNDRTYDMRALGQMRLPAEPTLSQMLNTTFFVETDSDVRSLLYVDSVLLSSE